MRAALFLLIGLTASCVVAEDEVVDVEVDATEAGEPGMKKGPAHEHQPKGWHHHGWTSPNGPFWWWKPPVAPPECTTDTACHDGDPCTDNLCIEGSCVDKPAREILLSGHADPTAVGWSHYGEAAAWTDGGWVTVDTASLTTPKPIAMYAFDLPPELLETHDLTWQMVVIDSSHNAFDASAAFFPAYSGWYGFGVERGQMMWFDPDAVGWGDESQIAAVNTTVKRQYRLHVSPDDGYAELYVNGELALSRENLELNGTIAFGDQTNDTDVDGIFRIREIALEANAHCEAP